MTSVKTPFINKVTFIEIGIRMWTYLLGGHYSTPISPSTWPQDAESTTFRGRLYGLNGDSNSMDPPSAVANAR